MYIRAATSLKEKNKMICRPGLEYARSGKPVLDFLLPRGAVTQIISYVGLAHNYLKPSRRSQSFALSTFQSLLQHKHISTGAFSATMFVFSVTFIY